LFFTSMAAAGPTPDGFAGLVDKLSPAVVNIATDRAGEGASAEASATADKGQRTRSLGSGFVVDASGLIVTNNHVVAGAEQIFVGLADGSRLAAVVAGRDAKTDIALLRVQPRKPLSAVALGDSDRAKAGDWVLAIGNPFGLGGSVSAGIISARNRQLDAELYDDFIQTDAAINRGNSGGPLFDIEGRVVGLNSSLLSPTGGSVGVGFAIPSNTVKTIVAQLRQFGRVRRGWIGANVQDLSADLAEGLALKSARGALIGHVTGAGPAAVAGLQPGDVVVRIDGKDVADSRMMQQVVVEASVGRLLNLDVMRKGKPAAAKVRVGRRLESDEAAKPPRAPPAQAEGVAGLGFVPAALTNDVRAKFRIAPGVEGAAVASVAAGSPAAESGMEPGDVVVEAGQEIVRSPQQLSARLATARAAGRGVIVLTLNRGGELSFRALRFAKRNVEKPLKTAGR
jgi:serine protease Do